MIYFEYTEQAFYGRTERKFVGQNPLWKTAVLNERKKIIVKPIDLPLLFESKIKKKKKIVR